MANFNRRITGGTAVRDTLKVLGLPAPASIVGSTDANALQMWALASDVGQKLITEHGWQFLSKEHTITTVVGQAEYDLPEDFAGYDSDSSWNRTSSQPLVGSLKEAEWQALKGRSFTGVAEDLFQVSNNKVVLFTTPTAVETIVLPYTSRGWVLNGASTYKDILEQDDELVLFDPQLFKSALKLAWLGAKGFDLTKYLLEYKNVLAAAIAADAPSRTLSLVGASEFPYLGPVNIPDTGYGS